MSGPKSRTAAGAGRRVKALLLALVAALTLTACEFDVYELPLPGGTDVGDDPIVVRAQFADVLDLVPRSTVKVNDVNVGKVTEIELRGWTALVTMELRRNVELPANATAELRQTSLLGEKFVSLAPPAEGASDEPLESGALIPLERTGRNPEVEEVLGALSLLLNGGGVAQLKTIASELNQIFEGREGEARSVLRQIRLLVSQLDDGKADIVRAIESLNRLAVTVRGQQGSINQALEELPSALTSLDRQRDDLIRMLRALNRLGDVGVRVIRLSKQQTIESFQQLVPVLTQLSNAGDDFVDAFHVFLTYPFIDQVVGRDPQVARNLHMGDYTNLSVRLDVTLEDDNGSLPPLEDLCVPLEELPDLEELPPLEDLCEDALDRVQDCLDNPSPDNPACTGILDIVVEQICRDQPNNPVCDTVEDPTGGLSRLEKCLRTTDPGSKACEGFTLTRLKKECKRKKYEDQPLCRVLNVLPGGAGGQGGGGLDLPDLPGVPRVGYGSGSGDRAPRGPTYGQLMEAYDPGLVSLLVPGMVVPR